MRETSVPNVQLLLTFARQWVAGVAPEDAIATSVGANSRGLGAIINYLGEEHTRREEVRASAGEYNSVLKSIKDRKLDACISIKLSQFGLTIGEDYCREIVAELLNRCRREGIFLWLDMEGSQYTSATLRIYDECHASYAETGLALQANLKRTEEDLHTLLPKGGIVRLVKGAYREDPSISLRSRRDVDESYRRLMQILFRDGERFALATHDDRLIQEGLSLQGRYRRDLEFQMLLGVRDPLKEELRSNDLRVLEYIPYGPQWLPYFFRRIRERPRILMTMFRSFLGS